MSKTLDALERLYCAGRLDLDYVSSPKHKEDFKIIEKSLKALEIIKKYPKWKGSIKYLLYMSNYWEKNNRVITKELLEDYDFPFEVEEYELLKEVFK